MSVEDFLQRYLDIRSVCNGYANTLQKRFAKLVAHAGRNDLAGVFNEAVINSFLGSLDGVSPHTWNKYRADFLSVWRAAADEDRVPYPQSRRIKRVRAAPLVIECYLEQEARSLVSAAEHLPGAYPNGVARRHYWPAIIRAAWDSGLRRGDLWKLKRSDIRADRTLVIAQNKTGKVHVAKFHTSTIEALVKAGGHLSWPICEWCFGVHFQEIVVASGIGRGTFRWLRRGSGSRIDADHPGLGHEQLGNSRVVFDRHYNAKLNAHKRPMPPEL